MGLELLDGEGGAGVSIWISSVYPLMPSYEDIQVWVGETGVYFCTGRHSLV